MKKILTLFAMSLLSWGMLSAQEGGNLPVVGDLNGLNEVTVDFPEQETVSPKFNLQVVVRDADTLYHDQDVYVSVEISDTAGNSYYESFQKHTSPNGLVSLVIGSTGEADVNLEQIDWSVATVVVEFYESEDSQEPMYSVNIPVVAVPYALQSGSAKLSTEQIAEYMGEVLNQAAVTEIVNTIVANEDLKDALKAKINKYMKSDEGKANAKEVAEEYLTHLDSINIREVCDALAANLAANPALKAKLKALTKQFILDNSDLAEQLVFWFLQEEVNVDDITRAYNTLQQLSPEVKQTIKNRLRTYLTVTNRSMVYSLGVYYIQHISDEDIYLAYNYFKATNTPVKNYLKVELNGLIENYLTTHTTPAGTGWNEDQVYAAIDNYFDNPDNPELLPVPDCLGEMTQEEFICTLKSLLNN